MENRETPENSEKIRKKPGRKPGGKYNNHGLTQAAVRALTKNALDKEKLRSRPLTEAQRAFVAHVAAGLSQRGAMLRAFPDTQKKNEASVLRKLALNPEIQKAIHVERERWERANMMTKKRVMDGFLEAIEIAKVQADSMPMIAGWREIAKMCGYFEPIKHRLEVSVTGEVVIQKLQALTDAQLLQLADGKADALEGEFSVLPPPAGE